MDINTLRQFMAQRDSISILETVDVHTGARSALTEFDHVIEAPNWTRDGRFLVYNSQGRIYHFRIGDRGDQTGGYRFCHRLQQRPRSLAG